MTGNQVEGNFIGTDVTGLLRLANGANGVIIQGGPSGNTIGGLTSTPGTGAGNVISGNSSANVAITGQLAPTGANTVEGNLIGTDATGLGAITNGQDGIQIYESTNNVIGGARRLQGNVILRQLSLRRLRPLQLAQSATGNLIADNDIGTNPAGTAALGNLDGVFFDTGASNNTVGGVAAGFANTIGFNSIDGVQDHGRDGQRDPGQCDLHGNGVLGIELGTSGVPSQNVLGGANSGPNLSENYPVLDSVAYASGSGTTIIGDVNTKPGTTVFVDFYANPGVVLPAYGQGQVYLGAAVVTAGVDGGAQFTFDAPALPKGAIISATATDAAGNTSEFGPDLAEDNPPSAVEVARLGATAGTTFNVGQAITFDASASISPDSYPLTYSWDFGDRSTGAGATANHAYAYDGTYVVTLTVNDGHGGIESTTEALTIARVPLALSLNSLPSSVAVGNPLVVSGTVGDAANNPMAVVVSWGDGSTPTTVSLAAGATTFSASHTFTSLLAGGLPAGISATATDVSNPGATPPPPPLVALTNSTPFDVGGSTAQAGASVDVVAPPISLNVNPLSPTSINENDSVTLTGTIVDPYPSAVHTLTISWGDGPSAFTTLDLGPGALAFSASHRYLNNPAGLATGAFPVLVTVTNNQGRTGSASASVTVANVAPTVAIQAVSPANSASLVSLVAAVTDPGTLDPHTYQWSVNGLTVASATGPGFTFSPHDFSAALGGQYVVGVVVTDDVGATAQAVASLLIGPSTSSHTIVLLPGIGGQVAETVDSLAVGTFTPGNSLLFYTESNANRVTVDPALSLPAELVSTPGGSNTLVGGSGDDTLFSARGVDTLIGTTGPTTFLLVLSGQDPVLQGSLGPNTIDLSQTPQNVTLNLGLTTPQVVDGGNDVVQLASGTFQKAIAGPGDDILHAANGVSTTLVGGAGNDQLFGSTSGNSSIVGGSGNTTVVGGGGNSIIYGSTSGNSSIVGGSGNTTVVGGGGNSIIYGSTSGRFLDRGRLGEQHGDRRRRQLDHLRQHRRRRHLGRRRQRQQHGDRRRRQQRHLRHRHRQQHRRRRLGQHDRGRRRRQQHHLRQRHGQHLGGGRLGQHDGGGRRRQQRHLRLDRRRRHLGGGRLGQQHGDRRRRQLGHLRQRRRRQPVGVGRLGQHHGDGRRRQLHHLRQHGRNDLGRRRQWQRDGGGRRRQQHHLRQHGRNDLGGRRFRQRHGRGRRRQLDHLRLNRRNGTSDVGGTGNSTVMGGVGNSVNFGTSVGNPSVVGGSGNTTVTGGGGNSVIYGSGSGDTTSVVGGSGNTTVVGGGGNSIIYGTGTGGTTSVVGGSVATPRWWAAAATPSSTARPPAAAPRSWAGRATPR